MARVKRAEGWPGQPAGDDRPKMRVLEFVANDGELLRELKLDGAQPEDLTCASNSALTAVMPDPDYKKPDADAAAQKPDPDAAPLVVSTSKRW